VKSGLLFNKKARLSTAFPQVWKQLTYFLVKSDASKHLSIVAANRLVEAGTLY
jgi:hypothetical protein